MALKERCFGRFALGRLALLLLSLSLLGLPAAAQSELQPHTERGVTFVSGGIGEGGLDAIREVEGNYNLRLLFAVQGSGQYLADIKVKLLDQKGTTLVDTVSDGPYFLARLAPGKYKVVVENDGKAQTKYVEISTMGRASLSFYWPES